MLALAVTSSAPSRKRSASIFTIATKSKREKIRPSTSSAREKDIFLSGSGSVSASSGAGGGSSRKTAPSTVSRLDPKKSSTGEPSSESGPSGTPLIVPDRTPSVSQVTDGDPSTPGGGSSQKKKKKASSKDSRSDRIKSSTRNPSSESGPSGTPLIVPGRTPVVQPTQGGGSGHETAPLEAHWSDPARSLTGEPSSDSGPSGTPLNVPGGIPVPGDPPPAASDVGSLAPGTAQAVQGPSFPTGSYGYPYGYPRPPPGYPIYRTPSVPIRPGFSDTRFQGYPDNRTTGYPEWRAPGPSDAGPRYHVFLDPRFAGYPDPWWVAPRAPGSHLAHGPYPTDPTGGWRRDPQGSGGPRFAHPANQPAASHVDLVPPQPPVQIVGTDGGQGRTASAAPSRPPDARAVEQWSDSDFTSLPSVHGSIPGPPPSTFPLDGADSDQESESSSDSSDTDSSDSSVANGPSGPSDLASSIHALLSKYMPELLPSGDPSAPVAGGLFASSTPSRTRIAIPEEYKEAVRAEHQARSSLRKPHSVRRIGGFLSFDTASTNALFEAKTVSKEATRFGAKVVSSVDAKAFSGPDRRIQEVEAGIRSGMRLSAFLALALTLRSRSAELEVSAEDAARLDGLLLPLVALVYRQLAATSLRVTEDRQRALLSHLRLSSAADVRPWIESLDPAAPHLFGGKFQTLCASELSDIKQAEELAKQASATKKSVSRHSAPRAPAVSAAASAAGWTAPTEASKHKKKKKAKKPKRSGNRGTRKSRGKGSASSGQPKAKAKVSRG